MVPPPRKNLVRYYGALGPNSPLRELIIGEASKGTSRARLREKKEAVARSKPLEISDCGLLDDDGCQIDRISSHDAHARWRPIAKPFVTARAIGPCRAYPAGPGMAKHGTL